MEFAHQEESVSQFEELREHYGAFTYDAYHYEVEGEGQERMLRITYDFAIPGLAEFHPTWTFPVRREIDENAHRVLDELIFQLGLAETISYYKITCPKRVIIRCGVLTKAQQLWWRALYYNGLGEFLYRNGIAVREEDLFMMECRTPEEAGAERPIRDEGSYSGFLVPVGGGKDSVVTLETLRGQDLMTYHINDDSAIDEVIEVFHGNTSIRRRSRVSSEGKNTTPRPGPACPSDRESGTAGPVFAAGGSGTVPAAGSVAGAEPEGQTVSALGGPQDCRARRTLDPEMLALNRQGYLNGHTPFSAIVAFSSVVAAFLNGRSYIALSNETSANETTVKDSFVNHQYSKSYEFEEHFQQYLGEIVTSDIHYFSLLRPLSEIQIAALFAQCRAYHPVFLSCNRGSKKGIWCGNCPKCLFVYIILTPFLTEEELAAIFGSKLLDKPTLEKDFRELVGIDENKPFECVGTRGEVAAALKNYVQRGGRSLLTDRYREEILSAQGDLAAYLAGWEERNSVPQELRGILKEKLGDALAAAGRS